VHLAAYGGVAGRRALRAAAKRVDPLRRTVTIAETLVDVGGHPFFGPPKTRARHRTTSLPRVTPAHWPNIWPPTDASPTIWCSPLPKMVRYN